MPTLTTPPILAGAAGTPLNGRVALSPTSTYTTSGGVVVTTAVQTGIVRDGKFFGPDGEGPLVIYPTPSNVGLNIVIYAEEITGTGSVEHGISRLVKVPNTTTVAWSALVDLVSPTTGGIYVVPPWAWSILMELDDLDAAVAAAQAAQAAAEQAAEDAGAGTGSVRHDVTQALSETSKARARTNIGAVSAADVAELAPSEHDHVRADITDSTATGRSLMGATSAANARDIIDALGSPNNTMTGIAFYSSEAALPTTGAAGVLYITPEA